jgi:hypothetical protein
MAIIIGSENQKGGLVHIILGIVVVILVVFGAYYVFFVTPPFGEEVDVPSGLDTISEISSVKVDPQEVLEPIANILEKRVGDPELGEFGRENPFSSF